MKSIIESVCGSIISHINESATESFKLIYSNDQLRKKLELIWHFGNQITLQASPADFGTLRKIGYFPFAEAATEMDYSLSLAMVGMYKAAYGSLRHYLELCLVGLYFLSLPDTDKSGREWLYSQRSTPFKAEILKKLLQLESFRDAEESVHFAQQLDSIYGILSDRTHTKGIKHGHLNLSGANRPRCVPASLEDYAVQGLQVCEVVAVGMAIQLPILLVPLPLSEKFGLNGPLSGFLEEHEVDIIQQVISPNRFEWLKARAFQDADVIAIQQDIESRDDLSEEEWKRQIEEQEQWMKPIGSQTKDSPK